MPKDDKQRAEDEERAKKLVWDLGVVDAANQPPGSLSWAAGHEWRKEAERQKLEAICELVKETRARAESEMHERVYDLLTVGSLVFRGVPLEAAEQVIVLLRSDLEGLERQRER